jgi:subtilisin family serine protease
MAPTDLSNGNPNPDLAPHVINNSWSCPTSEGCEPANFEAMRIAVSNLKMSGVVVVVSAGNSGPSCSSINTPAAIFEESFVVGATNFLDSMANFSSRGPVLVDSSGRMKPNVVAPGVSVRSCVPNGGYANYSGTSMAGPHVAGAVALLISAAPELAGKVELIEEILEQSAKPLFPPQSCGDVPTQTQPNHVEGWGRIDLWKALAFVRPDLFNNPEKVENTLRAFPNPSSGEFILISPVDIGSGRLLVSNYLGQKVLERNVEFTRIQQFDFSDLPNGMYVITVFPESCPKEKYSVQFLKRN